MICLMSDAERVCPSRLASINGRKFMLTDRARPARGTRGGGPRLFLAAFEFGNERTGRRSRVSGGDGCDAEAKSFHRIIPTLLAAGGIQAKNLAPCARIEIITIEDQVDKIASLQVRLPDDTAIDA